MSRQGRRIFADELTRFARELREPRVTRIAERVAAPLRVAVSGRRGTERRTVGRALAVIAPQQGMRVVQEAHVADAADVVVYVVAEAVKPEDTAAVTAVTAIATDAARPVLVLLNKADLSDGAAGAAGAAVAERIGAPTQPFAALPAVAVLENRLDDSLWTALQMLAAETADLSSADRFVTGPHRVPARVRLRLCDTLDLPGITRAVDVVRRGGSIAQVRAVLLRLSGIDAVTGRLAAAGAALRYRRLLDAVTRLEVLAVEDGRVGEFLSCDDTVAARMAAAVSVVEVAGLTVCPARDGDRTGQLRRALRWRCYSRGPVDTVHRACGLDIARGSLRRCRPAGMSTV